LRFIIVYFAKGNSKQILFETHGKPVEKNHCSAVLPRIVKMQYLQRKDMNRLYVSLLLAAAVFNKCFLYRWVSPPTEKSNQGTLQHFYLSRETMLVCEDTYQ